MNGFKKGNFLPIKLLLIFISFLGFFQPVYAQNEKLIKTEDKGFAESIPGLKQVEGFRMQSYQKCVVAQGNYDSQYSDKSTGTIIDTTKRDLAYQATQGVLPDSLRQTDDEFGRTGLNDSQDLIKYHANGICAKFLGSQLIFYGLSIIALLIIIKIFHR